MCFGSGIAAVVAAEVVWLRRAREELEEIAATIAIENSAAAERLIFRLAGRATHLAEYPRMGPRRRAVGASARILVERPYLLLYRTIPDSDEEDILRVEIVSLVDSRRDPDGRSEAKRLRC